MAAWQCTNITIATGPPTNLIEWLKDPAAVDFLKTLKWVRVGGGPLPSPVGDTLVESGVRVLNVRQGFIQELLWKLWLMPLLSGNAQGWGTTEVVSGAFS